MIRYLGLSLRRQLRQSRTLFVLTVGGVALGVASVVAIQTLNRGALGAFDGSVRAVSGQADLSVVGTTPSFPESLLVTVLGDPAVDGAWPICRVDVAVAGRPGLLLDVVGVDVFGPARYPLSTRAPAGAERLVADAAVATGWVALTPAFARRHGWAAGDTIAVSSGSRRADLVVGALVDFQELEPLAPTSLALMDIAQAQGLLARRGRIHQIDLRLAEGADAEATVRRLGAALGPAVRILTPEQRSRDAAGLLGAFRMNLTALSLISVFVGLFLVLTSVQASLVRRRAEFGVLRSLGAGRRQVLGLLMAEAAALGLLGVAAGVPLGYVIARWNIASVSGTLTSIYVMEGIETLTLPLPVILLGAGIGLLGAVGGSLLPSIDMARRDTQRLLAPLTLHESAGRRSARLAWLSLALALAATAWFLSAGSARRMGGFVYGGIMMVALPLIVPLVVRLACGAARPRGLGPALSLRNLAVRLQTSSFAVAALAVTVSMLVGVTILVGSFRQTLVNWLDVTIRADVYVTTESWLRAGDEAFLDRPLLDALAARPGVAAVEEQRRLRVRTTDGRHQVWLNGIGLSGLPGAELARRLPLLGGDPDTVAARLDRGQALIGEPLHRKAALDPGDTLLLAGPRGPVALPVAGVAYDYTSEGGTAFVLMETMRGGFDTGEPNNAALFLDDPAAVAAAVEDLRRDYGGRPLVFRSNADLRREVLAIFDQTFAVTRTLQTMALLIAVCGVSLTLLVQARERAGELALLRALGSTRRQVFGIFMGEGVAMGVLGLILGVAGGIGLAALLILSINRQWFGWTIQPSWPALAVLRQAGTVLAASALAAAVPALRAGLSGPGQLSRDDL